MRVIHVGSQDDCEHAIVYVERQDSEGDRVAVFSGSYRGESIRFARDLEAEGDAALVVFDDDVSAWPDVLTDFATAGHHLEDGTRANVVELRFCKTTRRRA